MAVRTSFIDFAAAAEGYDGVSLLGFAREFVDEGAMSLKSWSEDASGREEIDWREEIGGSEEISPMKLIVWVICLSAQARRTQTRLDLRRRVVVAVSRRHPTAENGSLFFQMRKRGDCWKSPENRIEAENADESTKCREGKMGYVPAVPLDLAALHLHWRVMAHDCQSRATGIDGDLLVPPQLRGRICISLPLPSQEFGTCSLH